MNPQNTIDIYELQASGTILWLYKLLEENKSCILTDDGLPIAIVNPISVNSATIKPQIEKKPSNLKAL